MANNRLYYAVEAVGIAPFATPGSFLTVRGCQTIGINTKFNLEQMYELGQLAVYEQLEEIPDLEITMEKVLDGYPLIYHLLTQGAASATLVGRSNQRAHLALSLHTDTQSMASGGQVSQCFMSGVYVSQVGYDIKVQGAAMENVTVVGNNKVWTTGGFTFDGFSVDNGVSSLVPAAPSGINRRQDIIMANCVWPTEIPGITSSGTNPAVAGSGFAAHIQNVRVSANLGREQMLELGNRAAYFRFVNFPVEVSTTIDVFDTKGDMVSATELGVLSGGVNLNTQAIHIEMEEGLRMDLGTRNKLQSVNRTGGDASSRNNATISYQYVTYNDFTVQHSADPTVALR